MKQSQQTSNPYSADVFKVHDENLIWVHKFGTETTADLGEAFTSTSATTDDPPAAINGRLAALELDSINFQGDSSDLGEPRGRTFLLPEWDTFPSPPITEQVDPDFKVMELFAHVTLREEPLDAETELAHASLILGPEALVGDAPTIPMIECSITQNNYVSPPMNRELSGAQVLGWETGGDGGPTEGGNLEHVPNSLYFRVLLQGSAIKQTDTNVAVSFNGIWWSQLGNAALGDDGPNSVVRRVGLASRGMCIASLDWMRLYNYPVTGFNFGETSPVPAPPLTGGRIFVP